MEEQLFDPEQPVATVEEIKKGRRIGRKITIGLGVLLAFYVIWSVLDIFISPNRNIQQIYLIPEDAAFIIQSSNPVDDWRVFRNSGSFRTLKKSKSFEDIAANVEMIDSVIRDNKGLLSLIGKRDMLISIHKTRSTDWDFLMVVDMQKASKLNMLKDQIELILRMTDFTVTQRTYNDVVILEMRDPETRDILYAAFVENHFVASYTPKLLEAAIDTRHSPEIGLDESFIEAEKLVSGKGLYRVFINYKNLPDFMSVYLGGKNEYLDIFSKSMDFAGLYFNADKDKMEMKGYTLRKEEADPYVTALLNSGKHKMKAHEIMSARTALYTNIGLGNLQTFIKELESTLSVNDKKTFDSYVESRNKIEKLFGISFDEHFLSWMSGEFALSQSEPGLLGSEPELILAIGAKNIKDARKNMEFIEKKIKSRTPINIKTTTYKDFEINYIEMRGFFRLFFGTLFDRFEKPFYTYIDDYVVFSNKASSLLSFIEDFEQKNLLKNEPGFKNAYANFSSSSTVFLFTDIHKFYPQLRSMLNATTWKELQSNKDLLYSFPFWTMQIIGDNESASLQYIMDYKPYEPEKAVAADSDKADEEDNEMDENADSERELMSELKRFYVEKFQGNVLRDFYPEGALKSESEIKDGKRHGRYREYYEDGTLKVRGKYVNNRPKGTWKYYTVEGKFDRKEKF